MQYKLEKIEELSGQEASIYTIFIEEENKTLFDKFIEENLGSFESEIKDIVERLQTIGQYTGAREHFFKIHEGNYGDTVCALYDNPDKKLRLYCIRISSLVIILGSGGSKNVRALQDDEKLKSENYFLRDFSKKLLERIKDGDIEYENDFMDFSGNLTFTDDEEY